MSSQIKKVVEGHPSIYEPKRRELEIFYTLPNNINNSSPGILLFIGGFGVDPENYYFKKFHQYVAEKLNLIPLQCNYFGHKFMPNGRHSHSLIKKLQNMIRENVAEFALNGTVDKNRLKKIVSENYKKIFLNEKENKSDFEDYSLMQAIDNVTALCELLKLLKKENIHFNERKIILFGTSHGAYLSYLCNIFAPSTFSLLIDSGSYISPFINLETKCRIISIPIAGNKLIFKTDRLVNTLNIDDEVTNISYIYKHFKNNTTIKSFHSVDDKFLTIEEKINFCNKIENCDLTIVDEKKIDGIIFKSTNHNDINISKLLYNVIKTSKTFGKKEYELKENVTFSTSKYKYSINYSNETPLFSAIPKTEENIYASIKR